MSSSLPPDTAPVRAGETLDSDRLSAWLGTPVLAIEQFPGGHSNLTYLVRTADTEYVLRRPPFGPVPPKSHDMVREAQLLAALHPLFPAAPRIERICPDPQVLGAPFFLMERRRGIVLRGTLPSEYQGREAQISETFAATLAQLHSLDVTEPPLSACGKPDGFLERQVRGWGDRWRRAALEPVPDLDRVLTWLEANRPSSGPPALVHNDFKLDNLMFAPGNPAKIAAVLDWEMAALGDPLCDLGLALTYWCHAEAPGLGLLSLAPGFHSRDELVQSYARRSGRPLDNLPYHEVLGVFKLAVILQQIYHRYVAGQTRDPRFAGFGEIVRELGRTASRLREAAA